MGVAPKYLDLFFSLWDRALKAEYGIKVRVMGSRDYLLALLQTFRKEYLTEARYQELEVRPDPEDAQMIWIARKRRPNNGA